MKLTLITALVLAAMSACNNAIVQEQPAISDPSTEFSDSVVVLDLRLYNKLDASNLSDMKNLWDVMQATACVQGIVNRDAPTYFELLRMYIKQGGTIPSN